MNKILLVTGASSEIGMDLIRRINKNYDTILAHYHQDSPELNELREELGDKLVLLQADFSDFQSVNSMISRIKSMDKIPDHIVHFPAPKAFNQNFHKVDWEKYRQGMEISVHSIVDILRAFIPYMKKKKYGKIVFMLTSCTLNTPPKYQSFYVTVKYALLGLMKSLSVEYADKGIMVNGVSPDMMETKFLSDIPELIVKQNAMNSPMGRNLSVSDVTPAIEYLLSDAADAVTGQNIGITGGL